MTLPRLPLALLLVGLLAVAGCDYATFVTANPPEPGPAALTPNVDATGATDVSAPMAAFFASVPNGSTIDLAPGGRYRMESTLVIDGRRDLTIRGHGATFSMTTAGDLMRASLRVLASSHITISDLNVVGANPLAGAKDRTYRAERGGQHGFDIDNSKDVVLDRVSATDTYGDFVYVGARDGFPQSERVTVRNSSFARSGRQGITVTAGDGVSILDSDITEPKRSMFDFEPGRNAGRSVTNVVISGNRLSKGPLLFVAAEGHGPVDHVVIENNQLTGMNLGMSLEDLDGGRRFDWTIIGNTADLPSGNPHGGTMRMRRLTGLVVLGNVQPMKPNRDMVGVTATESDVIDVSGNTFVNSVGQLRLDGVVAMFGAAN